MAELKLLNDSEPRNVVAYWTIRIGVAAFYLIFGMEKFGNDAHWVTLFREIGIGDWFRYFTGAVEVLGALLVLVPRTILAGLLLLSATMACAVVILCLLGRPADSVFPGVFLMALLAVGWHQRGTLRRRGRTSRAARYNPS
jgi:putative oxidoreductase